MIRDAFSVEDADRILWIPLATVEHNDLLEWKGESSGEFSVKSAYKLLLDSNTDFNAHEIQNELKYFDKKLWSLNLPAKQKITIWKVSKYFYSTDNLDQIQSAQDVAWEWKRLYMYPGFLQKDRAASVERFATHFGLSNIFLV